MLVLQILKSFMSNSLPSFNSRKLLHGFAFSNVFCSTNNDEIIIFGCNPNIYSYKNDKFSIISKYVNDINPNRETVVIKYNDNNQNEIYVSLNGDEYPHLLQFNRHALKWANLNTDKHVHCNEKPIAKLSIFES